MPEWIYWVPYILATLVVGGVSITLWELLNWAVRCQ